MMIMFFLSCKCYPMGAVGPHPHIVLLMGVVGPLTHKKCRTLLLVDSVDVDRLDDEDESDVDELVDEDCCGVGAALATCGRNGRGGGFGRIVFGRCGGFGRIVFVRCGVGSGAGSGGGIGAGPTGGGGFAAGPASGCGVGGGDSGNGRSNRLAGGLALGLALHCVVASSASCWPCLRDRFLGRRSPSRCCRMLSRFCRSLS